MYEFKLPEIGEGVVEGEIVRWHKQPGDASTPTRRSSRS
jgi:pyruvate/2-oxoglutarate dehydrogenase complex dihydrolipoamide acyltransferase (E2) component